jgi:hypothetical protein
VNHTIGYTLVTGLAIGAGIIILASTSASAGNDESAEESDLPTIGSFTFRQSGGKNVSWGELPLADEAAELAMSSQHMGSGTVFVPSSEEGPDQEDASEQPSR